jgi:outer membrane lipase/esterase
MRLSVKLCCAVASVALLASPAAAQQVDRIVAFGDSYADDGNLFELIGIPPPAIYANGRFSNGTNFVDTMGQLLVVPIDNFAIGGAFTDNGNINGPGIPGFVTEYQSFLAGGGPAAFPRVTGTFDANDLAVLSLGGNDARAYGRSLGLNPSSAQIAGLVAAAPGQAAVRVAQASVGLNALVDAGARNITFVAGDAGRLPEVRGLPIAAAGSAFSSAFNSGIQTELAEIAAEGVIVNYLDLNRLGDVVEANLSAFGLISAGACPIACVTTNPELLSQYLFYVDQLHLTSRGFEILGQYAVRQLEAPLHFEAQTESALQAATSFGSTLQGRLDLSEARSGGGDRRLNFFIQANAASRDFGNGPANIAYELDTFGLTGGAEYDGDGFVIGGALNWSRPEATITRGTGETEGDALQGGIYAGWAQPGGGAFVQGHASYGTLDLDIEREAVIDLIEAETDGDLVTAGARAGWLFGGPALRFGPVVAVNYAKADLDAYTETGDPVLTLNVGDQDVSALVGSAGAELRANYDLAGMAAQPYVSIAAERDFEGDGRVISYANTASPGIVNSFVLPDRSEDTYGRVTGGINIALGGAAALQIQASGTAWQEGDEDLSGFLGLRLGF